MAKSGIITGAKVKNLWLTFEWSRVSVDINKNTSTISWSLKLNSLYSLVFSADKSFTLKVNNQDYSGTFTTNINWGDSQHSAVIKSGTTTIAHNADGSKSFNVSAVFNIAVIISGTNVASISLSGTQTIDTIPRATTPTFTPSSGVKMGDTVKITLNRASTSFTHDLSYTFGKATGIIGDNIATAVSWTVPREFANQIPNGLSGICVISCKTYNGSTLIGTTSVSLTIAVNSADIPVIESVSIVEAVPGIAEKFNAFIQNNSKVNISINAKGVYGSTIKKYETKLLNTTYTASSFTSGLLTGNGVLNISIKVTDSRNRTATIIKQINVLPYTPPKISLFSCARVDNLGAEDNEGTYLKASMRFNIEPLGGLNDNSYEIEYSIQSVEAWSTATYGNLYTVDGVYIGNNPILNADYPYTIRLTLRDYFSTVSYSFDIATAYTLMDWHSSGKGIAFGKVSENENLFDVALPASFGKNVHFKEYLTYDIPQVRTGSINDFVTSGKYYLGNDVTDRPVNLNGWLEVDSFKDTFVYQRYVTYTGRIFERLMENGVWGDWCGTFTSGIWTYEKRLDGTLKCWGEYVATGVQFTVKVADSWYRPATNFILTYPETFVRNPLVFYSTAQGDSAGSVLAYTVGIKTDSCGVWLQKMVTGTANIKLAVEVIGKWK